MVSKWQLLLWLILFFAQIGWVSIRYWSQPTAMIVFCDVGQGDSILIQDGSYQVVVDTGPPNHLSNRCLQKYLPWWDHQIEMLVLTHPDLDHIGGAREILARYKVVQLVMSPVRSESADFEALESILFEKVGQGIDQILIPSTGEKLKIPLGSSLEVIRAGTLDLTTNLARNEKTAATEQELWDMMARFKQYQEGIEINANDESIVLFLEFKGIGVLLTGDLENQGETAVLAGGLLKQAEVLKVGHHGSKSSSSLAFIKKIAPEWAVISLGADNSYGHPDQSVISRLEKAEINVLRTDQLGSLELTVESNEPRWNWERN